MNNHTDDLSLANNCWGELYVSYTGADRHYHTLKHLAYMYELLQRVQIFIDDWDVLLCALFYHDIVYKPGRRDNEEKSARIAALHMKTLLFTDLQITRCRKHILATKTHKPCEDEDTNYLIDADLSILGAVPEAYQEYCLQVREEYQKFPDFIYKRGRKKVLTTFLNLPKIFHTSWFYDRFETQARENIAEELARL
ncbi:hypothetical protein [Ascidiimonas aurantiaca]|uniref:HD domain-containing protein n=1 Tax=Ascidiimonas aurantiaca TaxID=1685432 RepID=UPI0030ECDEFA